MSLTETDIKKLASLSRIKLSEEEAGQFAKEIDSILGYVEQIKEVSGDSQSGHGTTANVPDHRNILREDVADKNVNPNPVEVLESAPVHQDGFVKVKKILG